MNKRQEKHGFAARDLGLWEEAVDAFNEAQAASGITGQNITLRAVAPDGEDGVSSELWPMVTCPGGMCPEDEMYVIDCLRTYVMQAKSHLD